MAAPRAKDTPVPLPGCRSVNQASEEQHSAYFRDIADNLPVVLALANAQLTQFLFVNRAYETLWGRSVESVYANAMSFVDVVHPQDQPRIREALAGLVQGTPIEGIQCRLLHDDSSVSWVLCRGFPVRNPQGEIVRLVGTAQDITELKRIENDLRDSEDRYRDLVEHSSDLLCTHSLDGTILSINEVPLKILGYSREEMLHRPLRDFVADNAKSRCDAYLVGIQQAGFASGLLPVLTKKGEVRLWEYKNSLRKEGVEVPIVRGIAHDVTEQKRFEAALRKSEEKFSKAFHASPVEMFITDRSTGRILDINPSVEKAFGAGRAEIIGRTTLELGLWENAAQRADWVDELKRNGKVVKREVQVRLKGGTIAYKVHSAEPIRLGHQDCLLVASEDITERKKYEQELQQLSSHLLRLHEEERRNIARDLHDSTGQDLVGLSALLAKIQEDIPRANRKLRKTVSQALAVSERCIREVRTLSYVLYPPMLEETGLKDAISHYVKTYAKRTDIEVSLDVSLRFGRLNRDVELALFRVVQESLTNIRRHSGSSVAKIRLKRTPEKIVLEISDKGCGIPGFDRRHPPTYFAAVGVGLSGMAERLKQVGGQFEIDSSSSGTIVRGVIPIHEKNMSTDSHPSRR